MATIQHCDEIVTGAFTEVAQLNQLTARTIGSLLMKSPFKFFIQLRCLIQHFICLPSKQSGPDNQMVSATLYSSLLKGDC